VASLSACPHWRRGSPIASVAAQVARIMGAPRTIAPSDSCGLRMEALLKETKQAFSYLRHAPFLKGSRWYLAGGTALALQVGHRQSVDLDFFFPGRTIRESELERSLLESGEWKTTFRQSGTVYGTLFGSKISFIAYPFFKPSRERMRCGNVAMLTPRDIAAMKIIAISQRGRKRDFVDLHWYCTHREPLSDTLSRAMQQYPGQEDNLPHILKSLSYFADAENDVMPKMFFQAPWKEVKSYFQIEAVVAAKKLLRILPDSR